MGNVSAYSLKSLAVAAKPLMGQGSAVVGLTGREGVVIRKTLLPFAYYTLLVGSLGYAIVWWAEKGLVNVGSAIVLLIALAAILIKLDSPGPVLFRQKRYGFNNNPIEVLKFRTMRWDPGATAVPQAAREDPRVTPLGRILRRTSLDELPQLWNVLRGDMSLVGPRPERPEFVRDLSQQIPFYGQRHVVKPGVTGWAQVQGDYSGSLDGTMEKLQYDLFYIKNLSIALDLFIIFKTVQTVVLRRGT